MFNHSVSTTAHSGPNTLTVIMKTLITVASTSLWTPEGSLRKGHFPGVFQLTVDFQCPRFFHCCLNKNSPQKFLRRGLMIQSRFENERDTKELRREGVGDRGECPWTSAATLALEAQVCADVLENTHFGLCRGCESWLSAQWDLESKGHRYNRRHRDRGCPFTPQDLF